MLNPLTVDDAIQVLNRTSLPTVITEGRSDYQVLRRMERRLSDIGVDFLPLSGKNTVLSVWERILHSRQENTLAIVDLDDWIYKEIPPEFVGDNLIYTIG